MVLQHAQLEILELLVEMRAKLALAPTTAVIDPVFNEPKKGVTPANEDNLSAVRQPASIAEEPITLLTHFNIKALVR